VSSDIQLSMQLQNGTHRQVLDNRFCRSSIGMAPQECVYMSYIGYPLGWFRHVCSRHGGSNPR
jgi:hypothetical protein